MALIRAFAKVGKDDRIKLPANIRQAAGLREGRLVEMKVVGAAGKKSILMTPRDAAR